jgi:hypothetical protein
LSRFGRGEIKAGNARWYGWLRIEFASTLRTRLNTMSRPRPRKKLSIKQLSYALSRALEPEFTSRRYELTIPRQSRLDLAYHAEMSSSRNHGRYDFSRSRREPVAYHLLNHRSLTSRGTSGRSSADFRERSYPCSFNIGTAART